MNVNGQAYRSIWLADDSWSVEIIDQTRLPHEFAIERLQSLSAAIHAIKTMQVRGAPLIGATAAYGICLALREDASDSHLKNASDQLLASRPTAVNLRWAVEEMQILLNPLPQSQRLQAAYQQAHKICDDDVERNASIGEHGKALIDAIWQAKNKPDVINILTHCNAGWLATVDWGTALAPIYKAHDSGIPVHIWVDETRPRNQGASLTAWELQSHGVPFHVITDNAGGHLMQHQQVDLCIVGTDRTAANGDVCNKIGTYLKALAAHDNKVPFYVALPGPTIDWGINDGLAEIPIEERDASEVTHIYGLSSAGKTSQVQLTPDHAPAKNPAFDVTPARLITGLITERGICNADPHSLRRLFFPN